MKYSIVIPVFNEEGNVGRLHSKIVDAMKDFSEDYEIIFVDDGSTDKTYKELLELKNLKIIRFRKNFGQTAAMSAGFSAATGDVIISMDGDLQNDPKDIRKLVDKLHEGYDAVSGWRAKRRDSFSKKIFSRFANWLRGFFIRDPVHDSGCSLKAFRKECFEDIDLYGEMHRYIPAILTWKGFEIGEVKVNHYPRRHGKTKYGWKRLVKGFMDLINVWFWRKFSNRPLHLFGGFGILMMMFGGLLALYSLYKRIFFGLDLSDNFASTASLLLALIGVNFFISGLMADITIKTYYNGKGKKPYSIKDVVER